MHAARRRSLGFEQLAGADGAWARAQIVARARSFLRYGDERLDEAWDRVFESLGQGLVVSSPRDL